MAIVSTPSAYPSQAELDGLDPDQHYLDVYPLAALSLGAELSIAATDTPGGWPGLRDEVRKIRDTASGDTGPALPADLLQRFIVETKQTTDALHARFGSDMPCSQATAEHVATAYPKLLPPVGTDAHGVKQWTLHPCWSVIQRVSDFFQRSLDAGRFVLID